MQTIRKVLSATSNKDVTLNTIVNALMSKYIARVNSVQYCYSSTAALLLTYIYIDLCILTLH